MKPSIRTALPRAALVIATVLLSTSVRATEFPSATVAVKNVGASCFNITGPGTVADASAFLSGGDLIIDIPAGGVFATAAQVAIQGIPVNSSGIVPVFMSGAESLFGSGTASLTVDNGMPTAFSLELTRLNEGDGCFLDIEASGSSAAAASGNELAPSNTIVQADDTLSRLDTGVFADASRAAGQGLRWLRGLGGPTAVSLGPDAAGFSTRGMAAGASGMPWAVWGNAGFTSTENDGATTAFDANRLHFAVGADVAVSDKVILGIAGGVESDDNDTAFNSGNIETEGYTVSAYVGALLTDNLSADAAIGYSDLDIDQFRTAGTTRITSSLDGQRMFAAGNVNYDREWNDWQLTGTAGLLWAKDEQDAFVESDGTAVASSTFRLARLRLGAEVARTFGNFEPYVLATYSNSFSQTDARPGQGTTDRSDVLLGGGARFYGDDTWSGALEATTLLGRDNVDETGFNLLLHANF
jgi:hypothetical protein